MATSFPGSVDDFSEASPTATGTPDTTGRTHSQRHNDVESAIEAIETEVLALIAAGGLGSRVMVDVPYSGSTYSPPAASASIRRNFTGPVDPASLVTVVDGDKWDQVPA